ncbi:MAG: hypothetical protein J6O13_15145, partial [Selenomonas sp.]|nr:hypothetical protein [Selenomonas sp.]
MQQRKVFPHPPQLSCNNHHKARNNIDKPQFICVDVHWGCLMQTEEQQGEYQQKVGGCGDDEG